LSRSRPPPAVPICEIRLAAEDPAGATQSRAVARKVLVGPLVQPAADPHEGHHVVGARLHVASSVQAASQPPTEPPDPPATPAPPSARLHGYGWAVSRGPAALFRGRTRDWRMATGCGGNVYPFRLCCSTRSAVITGSSAPRTYGNRCPGG